jgi:hypothetical protein
MDDRPVVQALIGYFVPPFGLIGRPKIVSLDEAAIYHDLGFIVFIDPATEADLATWERRERGRTHLRKWFER